AFGYAVVVGLVQGPEADDQLAVRPGEVQVQRSPFQGRRPPGPKAGEDRRPAGIGRRRGGALAHVPLVGFGRRHQATDPTGATSISRSAASEDSESISFGATR